MRVILEGLDLFCGAGGAACGYERAGIRMTGVDIAPQPHYCGSGGFIQADAMKVLADVEYLRRFDFIHASPPCQGYSVMRHLPWLRDKDYPLLIVPVREALEASGLPYVIENVLGAKRVLSAGWLCGQMFGLPFYRHRLFATNWPWMAPGHPKHAASIRLGRQDGDRASNPVMQAMYRKRGGDAWQSHRSDGSARGYGHQGGVQLVRDALGIDWMNREEISQAIPPAYTEFIGRAWLAQRARGGVSG